LKYKVCGIVLRKDKTGSRLMADNFSKSCYILVKTTQFGRRFEKSFEHLDLGVDLA
jgi:hypothetical protein